MHPELRKLLRRRGDLRLVGVQVGDRSTPENELLLSHAQSRNLQLIGILPNMSFFPSELQLSGAIVSSLPTTELVQELLQRGVPTVRLGLLPHPDDDKVPAVIPDLAAAGRIAAEHFTDRGFKHLAYVGHEPWGSSQPLYDAFASVAKSRGVGCHLLRLSSDEPANMWRESRNLWIQQRFSEWISGLPKPLALLAYSNTAAERYCRWIIESGLRVPEDVAVLGHGNSRFLCECSLVSISSIETNIVGRVVGALDCLERLMAGKPPVSPQIYVEPNRVVTRQSTDVQAATNPIVVSALRYMWDHVDQDLSVDDIANAQRLSRRQLERAFKRELGRGVHQEFMRRRLEKARELLLESTEPLSKIAELMHFSSLTHFGRVFTKAFGQSPGVYRRRKR